MQPINEPTPTTHTLDPTPEPYTIAALVIRLLEVASLVAIALVLILSAGGAVHLH
jgi:hypothetical protein